VRRGFKLTLRRSDAVSTMRTAVSALLLVVGIGFVIWRLEQRVHGRWWWIGVPVAITGGFWIWRASTMLPGCGPEHGRPEEAGALVAVGAATAITAALTARRGQRAVWVVARCVVTAAATTGGVFLASIWIAAEHGCFR
jgi:hypothetical protein